ncbi:MAG: hypothetical protein ACK5NT_08205 [Pyrinomonadaceae bacterium]
MVDSVTAPIASTFELRTREVSFELIGLVSSAWAKRKKRPGENLSRISVL